jgi:hypothetical protein
MSRRVVRIAAGTFAAVVVAAGMILGAGAVSQDGPSIQDETAIGAGCCRM